MHETVELRELRIFLTLAEELHFGRTAARLGLTQSRVSQSLRTLERKLGDELMHRTSRRVSLTARGERFRAEVAPAIAQLTDVIERAATRQLEDTVRIGLMFPNTGGAQLVQAIDAFEAAHPGCDVLVTATPPPDPGRPLRQGEIDLLATPVLQEPTGVIVVATLGTEPRVLAVARDHPLARRTQVSTEDLGDYKVAKLSILPDDREEAWVPLRTPSGRPIERHPQRPESPDELAMLVARGKVVHPTVPSTSAHFALPNIVLVPITDLPPIRVVLLARPGPSAQRVREFVRVAKAVVGDRVA